MPDPFAITSTRESPVKRGWKYLFNATKWHYFVEGRSLCGKWMVLSMADAEDSNHNSLDNCQACRKKLLKIIGESV